MYTDGACIGVYKGYGKENGHYYPLGTMSGYMVVYQHKGLLSACKKTGPTNLPLTFKNFEQIPESSRRLAAPRIAV